MEEKLKFIFTNTNEWLKFAEAKNAVLITVNGAALFAILTIINDNKWLTPYTGIFFILVFGIAISLISSLISFIPKYKAHKLCNNKCSDNDNIIFYGDIQKYSVGGFLKKLYIKNGQNQCDFSNFEKDLANQIIINSKIALKKNKQFLFSVIIDIGSIVFSILYYLIKIIF